MIVESTVYASDGTNVQAFSRETGEEMWLIPVVGPVVAVANGIVYVGPGEETESGLPTTAIAGSRDSQVWSLVPRESETTERAPDGRPIIAAEPFFFEPAELTIQADIDQGLVIENRGVDGLTFTIDELGVAETIANGESLELTINAPVGQYTFYSTGTGHRLAGLTGTLHVIPSGRSEGATEATPFDPIQSELLPVSLLPDVLVIDAMPGERVHPDGCTVSARNDDDLIALAPAQDNRVAPADTEPAAPPTVDIPEGSPVDEVTRQEIVDLLTVSLACQNANDLTARLSLLSDDYARRWLAEMGMTADELEALLQPKTFDSVAAQGGFAAVRISHASPDAPAVDIWVNGEVAVFDLAFGEGTDVISLPGGSYDVAVTPAGSTDLEADAVISATLDLVGGEGYDVVATGNLDSIGAQVYPLDLTALDEGTSRIRFVHASPDAPAVDILLNGSVAIEGLEFPNASVFLEVPAGSYDVQVAVSETGDIAIDAPGVALEAGTVYTVMAIGEVGNGTLAPIILTAPAAAVGGEAAAASTDMAVTQPLPREFWRTFIDVENVQRQEDGRVTAVLVNGGRVIDLTSFEPGPVHHNLVYLIEESGEWRIDEMIPDIGSEEARAQAAANAAEVVPVASPGADGAIQPGCDELEAYADAMEAALFIAMSSDPDVLAFLFEAGQSDLDLDDATPEQLSLVARFFQLIADEWAKMEPPPFAAAWHENQIAQMEAIAEMYELMAAGDGDDAVWEVMGRTMVLSMEGEAALAEAEALCPAFGEWAREGGAFGGLDSQDSDVSPTPTAEMAEPTPEPDASLVRFEAGDILVVTEAGVELHATAREASTVVATLDEGAQVEVRG